ncbi:sigma 54-interacting transcriptional regulator [Heyndrickxia coagulans]|uniref:sigma 54-interacting transcriptional regulator n=1 Tax=Heyndrickxia coagulans TaxID=1398 RepID=UPI0004240368|nr:sigma 54-interacting transcriptional regulator [Heyndrickxia coagulans]
MKSLIPENKLWENIFSSKRNGIVVINKNSKILIMNSSAEELLNIKDKNYLDKNIQDIIPNTEFPNIVKHWNTNIDEQIVIYNRRLLVSSTPLYENHKLLGAIIVIQDITQIERYRDHLKKMEAIIEFSTDGIYVTDHNGITILVNSEYENITGFKREELLGNHMADLMKQGYIDQSVSLLVLERKKRISIMQKINGKKDVIVTGNPVFDETGNIEMVVTSVRDITHLNDLRQELEKAKCFSKLNNNRYTFKMSDPRQPMIFKSQKMRQIYDEVKLISPHPTSVLISGESGTGKEVVANLIHKLSDRKDQPFIKVNCGAIPESLMESELFGYEKGAFTGAREEGKIGLLELANGGTIMLDEIGEMPLQLQVKLLRTLQEKQIQRIGGKNPRNLDIRIISVTNQNLRKLVKEGKFREDLFYRLLVVEIQVPPLRERQEDIEELIDHYFLYYCREYKIKKSLSSDTKNVLRSYNWPGNVRELRNLMESIVVSIPANCIEISHLPPHIYKAYKDSKPNAKSFLTLKNQVEQFEMQVIRDSIQENKSIRKAAKQLGVSHSTLVKKMKRWEMIIE